VDNMFSIHQGMVRLRTSPLVAVVAVAFSLHAGGHHGGAFPLQCAVPPRQTG